MLNISLMLADVLGAGARAALPSLPLAWVVSLLGRFLDRLVILRIFCRNDLLRGASEAVDKGVEFANAFVEPGLDSLEPVP